MMTLQVFCCVQFVFFFASTTAYTIYGTKRYDRSLPHRLNTPYTHYPQYDTYPYQNYPDDYYYYPQDSYPAYYPPTRTSKYEVYQAVLPYYYNDRPLPKSYYDSDPMVDMQDELNDDDTQPIGHEMLYDNRNNDQFDDANAAFLQNLIMSQMYRDALDNQNYYYPTETEYGHWEDSPNDQSSFYQEDEDVRELKQLAKSQNIPKGVPENLHWFQRSSYRDQQKNKEIKRVPKKIDSTSTSTAMPITTSKPKRDSRGQKEEVMMRPATPVHHPFSEPVLEMMSKNEKDKKRTPSVYDTIRHMLDMEKNLELKYGTDSEIRPSMKKRIISSEESLAQQLSVLKKAK